MTSNNDQILFEIIPFIRVFKDGHVDRIQEITLVPPSKDPHAKVLSKDIIISSSPENNNVSVRLYMPKNHQNKKLPLLIYFHGGGFCIESAFSKTYHTYLNNLVAEANVIAVSVDYRLAPEHPIPACYDDSWSAIKWVVSNAENDQDSALFEPWLRYYADFSRIFLAGDSAGGNISHNMMVRASETGEVKLLGMALIHPFFGNGQPDKYWNSLCKDGVSDCGLDDLMFNPAVHHKLLEKFVCKKILICTAEKDFCKERGECYYEAMKKSGWSGEIEIMNSEGEEHVFHLLNPWCDNANKLLKKVAAFFN